MIQSKMKNESGGGDGSWLLQNLKKKKKVQGVVLEKSEQTNGNELLGPIPPLSGDQ